MIEKLKKLESIEGLGIVLVCLLIIVFGPLAKLLAYGGFAYGLYKIYKEIKE